MVADTYRATFAVRQHVENSVLRESELTGATFVVLCVVWIWGESETRHVAEEAGTSKRALTGVGPIRAPGVPCRPARPSQ